MKSIRINKLLGNQVRNNISIESPVDSNTVTIYAGDTIITTDMQSIERLADGLGVFMEKKQNIRDMHPVEVITK